jgi:hypothetical protein
MSSNLDDWLSEGLSAAPAPQPPKAAAPAPPTPKPRTPPPPNSVLFGTARNAPQAPPASPGQRSIPTPPRGKGGLIRNESTKIRSQISNPVTNPKKPKGRVVAAPTADEELRAEHPELAVPTLMTGMDVDANKPKQSQAPQETPQKPQRVVTGETTLKQMVEWAAENGGKWNIGNNNFVCTIAIHNTQVIPPAAG